MPYTVWICPENFCQWVFPDPPERTDGVTRGIDAEEAARAADLPVIEAAYAEYLWLGHPELWT